MIFVRDNNDFGQLEIDQIFLYFDGPRLFLATNAVGEMFLVNCLDSTPDGDVWLMASVSDRRLSALLSKELQLRDAFAFPELGRVQEIATNRLGELLRAKSRFSSQLTGDDLPAAGVYLPATEEDQAFVSAPFLARSLNATIVLLRLFPGTKKHEAPADSVGLILSTFSEFLTAKLQNAYSRAQWSLKDLPEAINTPVVNVVGSFAGSLGVEFAVRGDDPTISEALRAGINDLASVSNLDDLEARMRQGPPAEFSSMRKFLSHLADAESDLSVETASSKDEISTFARAPLQLVRESAREIKRWKPERPLLLETPVDPALVTLEGELIGLNLRTKTFEIVAIKDGEIFKGVLSSELFTKVSKAELPSRYRVVLESTPKSSAGQTRVRMVSATKL